MGPISTILVPTDFSEASARALAYACELAAAHTARLHILHVIEEPFAGTVHPGALVAPPEGYFEHVDQQTMAKLRSLLNEDEQARFSVVFATRMGRPAAEIRDYIRTHGAIDLVVIASAGHSALARLTLGSVTDAVVRTAPCPVLVAHPRDRSRRPLTSAA